MLSVLNHNKNKFKKNWERKKMTVLFPLVRKIVLHMLLFMKWSFQKISFW